MTNKKKDTKFISEKSKGFRKLFRQILKMEKRVERVQRTINKLEKWARKYLAL